MIKIAYKTDVMGYGSLKKQTEKTFDDKTSGRPQTSYSSSMNIF